ncbi:MAG TPA: hypothetical protein VEW07_07815 [Solirubrobacterales bacterium]|nr:hypothetical protein [Solirubrobacterales bacterium]
MFSLLRNRFGIPGVISVIALVFAMAGGALAAKKYVITSTSQIKPSVLKSLQGQAGAPGATGAAGSAGAAGAKGDAGNNGAPGKAGEDGADGVSGEPWVVGTAPTGALMKGTWAFQGGVAAAENEEFFTAISTTVPIAPGPFGQVIVAEGGQGPCPNGSAANPQPAVIEAGEPNEGEPSPGVMCLFFGEKENIKPLGGDFKLNSSGGGLVLRIRSAAAGAFKAYGSWAMIAP